jgi:hypothetical protein
MFPMESTERTNIEGEVTLTDERARKAVWTANGTGAASFSLIETSRHRAAH